MVSPVAFKVDVHLFGPKKGIGINYSVGIPKIAPVAYRFHGGATYYTKYYDNSYTGWETRKGREISYLFGVISNSGTHIDNKINIDGVELDQTLGMVTIGIPGLNFKYNNDIYPNMNPEITKRKKVRFWKMIDAITPNSIPRAEGGDRYRSAAGKLNIGFINIGFNLYTGDPGYETGKRKPYYDAQADKWFYGESKNGDNPDLYRAGIAYFGIGSLRFGRNSEGVRNFLQNQFAHDPYEIPNFKMLDRDSFWFFSFSTGSAETLW